VITIKRNHFCYQHRRQSKYLEFICCLVICSLRCFSCLCLCTLFPPVHTFKSFRGNMKGRWWKERRFFLCCLNLGFGNLIHLCNESKLQCLVGIRMAFSLWKAFFASCRGCIVPQQRNSDSAPICTSHIGTQVH